MAYFYNFTNFLLITCSETKIKRIKLPEDSMFTSNPNNEKLFF